jgi:hypothetical protein
MISVLQERMLSLKDDQRPPTSRRYRWKMIRDLQGADAITERWSATSKERMLSLKDDQRPPTSRRYRWKMIRDLQGADAVTKRRSATSNERTLSMEDDQRPPRSGCYHLLSLRAASSLVVDRATPNGRGIYECHLSSWKYECTYKLISHRYSFLSSHLELPSALRHAFV